MATWLYKATEAKVPRRVTQDLLGIDRFVCRTPNDTKTGKPAKRVAEVQLGDILHVYCVWKGADPGLGSYEVISKEKHDHPERFGDIVEGTALYVVTDDEFIKRRDADGGYDPDPELGAMTGWLLKRLGPAMPYDSKKFKVSEMLVPHVEA